MVKYKLVSTSNFPLSPSVMESITLTSISTPTPNSSPGGPGEEEEDVLHPDVHPQRRRQGPLGPAPGGEVSNRHRHRSRPQPSPPRSFSVSESSRNQSLNASQNRTPHRIAGYGGAGQPSRGPHRYHSGHFTFSLSTFLLARPLQSHRLALSTLGG